MVPDVTAETGAGLHNLCAPAWEHHEAVGSFQQTAYRWNRVKHTHKKDIYKRIAFASYQNKRVVLGGMP